MMMMVVVVVVVVFCGNDDDDDDEHNDDEGRPPTGISMSLIYGPMFVVLGRYFNRRLALAQAIANTGVSVGALVMPMVIRVILDHYSFPSGLLMVGGMACHMFVCAFLFRPVSDEDLAGALR